MSRNNGTTNRQPIQYPCVVQALAEHRNIFLNSHHKSIQTAVDIRGKLIISVTPSLKPSPHQWLVSRFCQLRHVKTSLPAHRSSSVESVAPDAKLRWNLQLSSVTIVVKMASSISGWNKRWKRRPRWFFFGVDASRKLGLAQKTSLEMEVRYGRRSIPRAQNESRSDRSNEALTPPRFHHAIIMRIWREEENTSEQLDENDDGQEDTCACRFQLLDSEISN
jgi:hypothetical protein